MSGETPNGFPFAVGSDALTDWPPVSEELAGMLDTATLLGSPVCRVRGSADQIVNANQNMGVNTMGTTDFAQGGLAGRADLSGILIGRPGLYFAVGQVGWDTYGVGQRQLILQNWGSLQLGSTAVVPSGGGYTVQQASGVMYLAANDVIQLVVAQNSDRGITLHAAYSWLFVVQIAVFLPTAAAKPAPGPKPPDPQVLGEMIL